MTSKVTILYMRHVSGLGSAVMRSLQLAEIAARHVSERYEVSARALPKSKHKRQLNKVRDLMGGVVILTKHAIADLDEACMDHLWRHNVVLADWIDMAPRRAMAEQVDVHIAASMTQYRRLLTAWPDAQVEYLPHHADLRLTNLSFRALPALSALYLGHPNNLKDGEQLSDYLTVVPVQGQPGFEAFLPRIPGFNLHFNMRSGWTHDEGPQEIAVSKPLTKAFNAAVCQSNIVLQRSVEDAEEYLGADYPYLLDDDSPATVQAVMERIRDDFGGPDWLRGLEIMRSVADRVSPLRIGNQLENILDRARYVPRPSLRLAA